MHEPEHRHLPQRWSIEELDACFVLKDEAGQKVAFIYFEREPGRRLAAKLLTHDDAQQIAINIANLSELLRLRRP